MTAWEFLGIDPGAGEDEIRRAYARRLKTTRPDVDPAAFQQLRSAYEFTMDQARQRLAPNADVLREQFVPPASADAVVFDTSTERPITEVAREILDACSPVNFDPPALRDLVASLPELVPLQNRLQIGLLLAHYVADGVALNPHAIVYLGELFGWNDVGVVQSDPVFRDPRFLERSERARSGSRPSTRQHQTPPVAGISIATVLIVGLVNLGRMFGDRPRSHRASSALLQSTADIVGATIIAVAAITLLGWEYWTQGQDLSASGQRWRWIARIVLGAIAGGGILYFVGRPTPA